LRQKYVAAFEVSMQNALLVYVFDGIRNLHEPIQNLLLREVVSSLVLRLDVGREITPCKVRCAVSP
jgi:hypothetical protein